ncbi:MAG: hypothetical protein ACT4QB_14630 [Gammaproteobacteria bacterium]
MPYQLLHVVVVADVHDLRDEELRLRARRLAGWTLSDLAGHLGERSPLDLRRAKGWVGEALERALGGIELKSIRVAHDGLLRGFYLRATFAAGLLRRHFLLP